VTEVEVAPDLVGALGDEALTDVEPNPAHLGRCVGGALEEAERDQGAVTAEGVQLTEKRDGERDEPRVARRERGDRCAGRGHASPVRPGSSRASSAERSSARRSPMRMTPPSMAARALLIREAGERSGSPLGEPVVSSCGSGKDEAPRDVRFREAFRGLQSRGDWI
jgi:hypothetical protein